MKRWCTDISSYGSWNRLSGDSIMVVGITWVVFQCESSLHWYRSHGLFPYVTGIARQLLESYRTFIQFFCVLNGGSLREEAKQKLWSSGWRYAVWVGPDSRRCRGLRDVFQSSFQSCSDARMQWTNDQGMGPVGDLLMTNLWWENAFTLTIWVGSGLEMKKTKYLRTEKSEYFLKINYCF